MNIQLWIVIVIVVAAVGYAARRIYINFRRANDPCYGCTGCALKDMKQKEKCEKEGCCHKK